MKSYTTLRNLFGSLTNNSQTGNLTLGDQLINDSIRTIYNLRNGNWWFLETTKTVSTVASQAGYQVPNGLRKLMDVYVQVGNTIYMPEAVFDPNKWKLILAYRMGESDIPLFYYRDGNKVHFAPTPASNGNTITMRGRRQTADLNQADITSSTVAAITSGATAVTLSAGATASWVGRYIRITETNAANGGDGQWYEIGSYTDATTIGLLKPYEGTTITAGTAACTVGQMSFIPQAYDVAPVYRAVALYWQQQNDLKRSETYWRMYDGGVEAGYTKIYGGLIGQMLENESETVEGAYISPFGTQANLVNTGAWWSPWQSDASGF